MEDPSFPVLGFCVLKRPVDCKYSVNTYQPTFVTTQLLQLSFHDLKYCIIACCTEYAKDMSAILVWPGRVEVIWILQLSCFPYLLLEAMLYTEKKDMNLEETIQLRK